MPNYKVKLKSGSRSVIDYIEAKSTQDVISFFKNVTSMSLVEIVETVKLNVNFSKIDNPSTYWNYLKVKCENIDKEYKYFEFYSVKKSLSTNSIYSVIFNNFTVNSKAIKSISIEVLT